MNKYRTKKSIKKLLFVLLALLVTAVPIFPMVAMVSISLKKANDVFTMPVTWIPKTFTFEDYMQVFGKIHILSGFKTGLIITGLTISLVMVIAIPASYAFSCLDFYFKKQIYYLVPVSRVFAPTIVIIPLYTMVNRLGLIDSRFSLVLISTILSLAFVVLILKATFSGVPRKMVGAAKIDGCSPSIIMARMFLPVSSTGIVIAVIPAFTRTWSEFLFAFILISTTEKKSVVISLYEILKNDPAVKIL